MSDAKQQAYPTIRESWVILGVNLLLLIVTIPIGIIAYKFLDDQLAFLIAYVFVNGMVFWWAYGVRKSKTGRSSFSLDGFLRLYSPKKAILYSSFLFGLVHMNPWQFITAMVGGVFMGWVYYRTKNLFLCILIHFVNNFIPSVASYFLGPEMKIELSYTEYYGGIAPMIIIIITALIVAFTSIFLLYEEFEMREKIEWGELDPAVEEHHQVHKVGV
ncbi:CPBP family intramembrane metalloprotease [Membranicola marinus]|uniref:CPBP family intramembrane metalloprotease n=1 Tax=Membranihabitans marinus TaxID=1227546 RepID=A0A953HMX3_9BACT|nr:CPBP family intramembrane glutamic endopeptidase [Membranihabitans marinus]MBY5958929.1 CPBP family intramembrane metalloprotease [Membranihabitans marinus]